MLLTADIKSTINPKKMYGKKGDRVKVLSDHDPVSIVEIKEGNGFAVKSELLSTHK